MVKVPNVHEFLANKERPEMWRLKTKPKTSTQTNVHWKEMCPECGQEYREVEIEMVGGTVYGDYVCPSGHTYTIKEPPGYADAFL